MYISGKICFKKKWYLLFNYEKPKAAKGRLEATELVPGVAEKHSHYDAIVKNAERNQDEPAK